MSAVQTPVLADTPDLALLIEGVQLVLEQVTAGTADATREARWARFYGRLTRKDTGATLAHLVRRFGLDTFATRCLLLATAPHLLPRFGDLIARRDPLERTPTVSVALEVFWTTPEEQVVGRRAFSSNSPLIRHGLVVLTRGEGGAPDGLLNQRLEVGSATLRFLLGEPDLSENVARYARIDTTTATMTMSTIRP